jgi:hypothetical protein
MVWVQNDPCTECVFIELAFETHWEKTQVSAVILFKGHKIKLFKGSFLLLETSPILALFFAFFKALWPQIIGYEIKKPPRVVIHWRASLKPRFPITVGLLGIPLEVARQQSFHPLDPSQFPISAFPPVPKEFGKAETS